MELKILMPMSFIWKYCLQQLSVKKEKEREKSRYVVYNVVIAQQCKARAGLLATPQGGSCFHLLKEPLCWISFDFPFQFMMGPSAAHRSLSVEGRGGKAAARSEVPHSCKGRAFPWDPEQAVWKIAMALCSPHTLPEQRLL